MRGTTTTNVGVALLQIPILYACYVASNSVLSASFSPLVWLLTEALGLLLLLRLVWIGYRFRRAAIGTRAEPVVLWAFVLSLAIPVLLIGLSRVGSHSSANVLQPLGLPWPYQLVGLIPAFLFALGLLKSRLVADWLPWLAVAWVAMAALEIIVEALSPPLFGQALELVVSTGAVSVLVALGTALVLRREEPDERAEHRGGSSGHAEPALPADSGSR